MAGYQDGFFIRGAKDTFRLYPTGLIHADVYGSFDPGAKNAGMKTALPPDVASGLATHMLLRRARIGIAGEILQRWSFALALEFGGQPIGNAAGTNEASAAK